jgi:hypothetical protein
MNKEQSLINYLRDLNSNTGKLIEALMQAKRDNRIGGIILTNTDSEADYNALVAKNRAALRDYNVCMESTITKSEDGSIHIECIIRHLPSSQFKRSKTILRNEINRNPLEVNSPEVFFHCRDLYEGLLGIASSNNAIEAELFGPQRKHQEIKAPYDKTADYIYSEYSDHTGKKYRKKIDRREFEKLFLGMTSEEEAETKFNVPIYRQLSRSDIQLFLRCKRCFYNTKKLRIRFDDYDNEKYGLEKAAESLLKKEFDFYRKNQKSHPIMKESNAIRPLKHKKLDGWRTPWTQENRYSVGGIQFHNVWENWMVYGGIDDIWLNDKKELIVVDYKSSTTGKLYPTYQQQLEFYAWILKKRNYAVSSIGYLLIYRPITNKSTFDWKLDFEPKLHKMQLDDSWVQQEISNAIKCLSSDAIPLAGHSAFSKNKKCNLCDYGDKLLNSPAHNNVLIK